MQWKHQQKECDSCYTCFVCVYASIYLAWSPLPCTESISSPTPKNGEPCAIPNMMIFQPQSTRLAGKWYLGEMVTCSEWPFTVFSKCSFPLALSATSIRPMFGMIAIPKLPVLMMFNGKANGFTVHHKVWPVSADTASTPPLWQKKSSLCGDGMYLRQWLYCFQTTLSVLPNSLVPQSSSIVIPSQQWSQILCGFPKHILRGL